METLGPQSPQFLVATEAAEPAPFAWGTSSPIHSSPNWFCFTKSAWSFKALDFLLVVFSKHRNHLVIPKCGRCLVGEVLSFMRETREESNYKRNGEDSASDIWAWASWQGERWFSRLTCQLPQQAKGRTQMLSHILLYVGPTVVLMLAFKQK